MEKEYLAIKIITLFLAFECYVFAAILIDKGFFITLSIIFLIMIGFAIQKFGDILIELIE